MNDKQPIIVDTMDDFQAHGYSLAAFCDGCFRHHEFDIEDLIAKGHGGTSITAIKPRCSKCGEPAQKLVSPRQQYFEPTGG